MGFEPTTTGLWTRSSTHYKLERPALGDSATDTSANMARPAGLEPATLGLEGRCSIRLSYGRFPECLAFHPQ